MSMTVVGPPSTLIAQSRRCASTTSLMSSPLTVLVENRYSARAGYNMADLRIAATSTSARMPACSYRRLIPNRPHTRRARSFQYGSRSWFLRILPLALRGSDGTKSTVRGHL